MDDPELVRRADLVLRPDPSRVIAKLFLPGQESATGISRADAVIGRVLAMTTEEVAAVLDDTAASFAGRHRDLPGLLAEHFGLVEHRLPEDARPSPRQRELIGAYFTAEYAVQAAAFFNPSMVAHPDQSGLAAGELRFLISARAVGEGHISSVEFRTGVLGPSGSIRVDPPGRPATTGRATPATLSRHFLRQALAEFAPAEDTEHVLGLLPELIGDRDLEVAAGRLEHDRLTRPGVSAVLDRIRWFRSCNYRLDFPPDSTPAERVIYPTGVDESHGIEDVRLTRFVAAGGAAAYYGTYTAYDGSRVAPHLFRTGDFRRFEMTRLVGPAAKDKGMALFPRPVAGRYLALSRWDRESIGIAASPDGRCWDPMGTLQVPNRSWEIVQLGNCGPPVETAAGWLVLTHGVGAMRTYRIGAILLDLEDPTRVIGALQQPLLTPAPDERDGYVPNVVYSCGALLHDQTLVVPYGCSDFAIRFALVDLPSLLQRLQAGQPA